MNAATEIVLFLAALGFLYRALRGPALADRAVGMNGLLIVLSGLIASRAAMFHSGTFLATLVALAVIGPVGNGMIARYIERRAE